MPSRPPIQTPVLDKHGLMSPIWALWLQRVFGSVGSGSGGAPLVSVDDFSAIDLAENASGVRGDLQRLQDRIELLEGGSVSSRQLVSDDFSALDLAENVSGVRGDLQRLQDRIELLEGGSVPCRVSSGVWTPVFVGLTVVGPVTISGNFLRIKGWQYLELLITPTFGSTTSSTNGVTTVNNLPYKAFGYGVMSVSDIVGGGFGSAVVQNASRTLNMPSWAVTGAVITISGLSRIQEGL